jgi:hypothetical protein
LKVVNSVVTIVTTKVAICKQEAKSLGVDIFGNPMLLLPWDGLGYGIKIPVNSNTNRPREQ